MSKNAVNMGTKAANKGDRLKHALLSELIERVVQWPDVAYAETHAGAGIYQQEGQVTDSYVEQLREIVESVADRPSQERGAGMIYLRLLKNWWSQPSNRCSYPGSVLQAVQALQRTRPHGDFTVRATEKDGAAYRSLKSALQGSAGEALNDSFQNKIDWLCGRDNLVLLVDPFGCVESFGQSSHKGVNEGYMDIPLLKTILERCSRHERAVIQFWTATSQNLRNTLGPINELLRTWCNSHDGRLVRSFHDQCNHRSFLIGINGGQDVVADVPRSKEWHSSWLSNCVYEIS